MQALKGKVALITGTAGGQGQAAAHLFAAEGAQVIGCDIAGDHKNTIKLIEACGGSFTASDAIDLGDPDAARAWVEAAAKSAGRIDIVYNNASAAKFAPFHKMSVADWRFTMRNELDLVFYVTRFAWPFLQQRGGVVINIASISGLAGSASGAAAHATTKGGVIALTRQLAAEGAPDGIRVLAISPGVVETPGTAPMLTDPSFRDRMLAGNMIKRFGTPEEVARLALYLVGSDAEFITATNLVIDGGRSAW